MTKIGNIRKLLKDSLLVRALVAIILAIPAMVFVESIDESGFGSALTGGAIIIFVFSILGGTENDK